MMPALMMGDFMKRTQKRPLTLEEATQPLTEEPSAGIRAWQDEQTRQAIREADAGDFATAEEVKAVIRRYVPHD